MKNAQLEIEKNGVSVVIPISDEDLKDLIDLEGEPIFKAFLDRELNRVETRMKLSYPSEVSIYFVRDI